MSEYPPEGIQPLQPLPEAPLGPLDSRQEGENKDYNEDENNESYYDNFLTESQDISEPASKVGRKMLEQAANKVSSGILSSPLPPLTTKFI